MHMRLTRDTSAVALVAGGALLAAFSVPMYLEDAFAPAVIAVAVGAFLVVQGLRSARDAADGRSDGPSHR